MSFEKREFERDFLAGMIMLQEGSKGNPVSYENAAQVANALVKKEEKLPFELLESKSEV